MRYMHFGTDLVNNDFIPIINIAGIRYGIIADMPPQAPITRVTALEHRITEARIVLLLESWDPDEVYYHARIAVADLDCRELWHTWILGRGHECQAVVEADTICFLPDMARIQWASVRDAAITCMTAENLNQPNHLITAT